MGSITKFNKCFPLGLSLLLVAGCTISKHEEISKNADREMDNFSDLLETFKARRIQDMPQSEVLEIDKADAWLYEEVTSDYSAAGFRVALKTLFPGTPIVFADSIPASFTVPVVAPPQAFTKKDHLNSISLQTNLGWSVAGGVLYISPNMVTHYPIPLFGSSGAGGIANNIKLSNDNLGDDGGSSGFRNALEGEISPYLELANIAASVTGATMCEQGLAVSPVPTLRPNTAAIYGAPACYALSGAGNVLVMNARPQQHAVFASAYHPWYKSVNTQVQITLKILQTDVTDIAQQAIDPSILRSAAISAATGLSHFEGLGVQAGSNSQNFVSFDESANGLTFTFDEGSRYAGSELIIKALNQVGKTFVSSSQEFTARNNQLNSFVFEEETPFLESVSVSTTNTSANSSSTAPTLTSNSTLTGSALNVIATVTGDEIGLRIIINEKILGEREDFQVSTPDTMVSGSRFGLTSSASTFTPTLRDGDVALLVSSERKNFDIQNGKNDLLPFIGDTYSAKGRVFNTLYLIEAHIVR
jgi:hypothetical protein